MNFSERREKLLDELAGVNIAAALVQNLENIYYLSGYSAPSASRPFGLLFSRDKTVLIAPMTSSDDAKAEAEGLEILTYYEHPAGEGRRFSFYAALDEALSVVGGSRALGVEADRITAPEQAALSNLGCETRDIGDALMRMRLRKAPDELEITRTAGGYADFIISETLKSLRPGISELELSNAGVLSLHRRAEKELPGSQIGVFAMTTSGPKRTALPHTNTTMRELEPPDSAILCRQLSVNLYRAQCDRLIFLGNANPEQARYYGIVLAAHSVALEAIRPGVRAAEIDGVIREVFAEDGLDKYCTHRVGCGLGLSPAEPPYLRFDNDERIEANTVLVLQPAIYLPGIGGFRCTDTLIVTESGAELVTNHPRALEALTVQA